MPIYRHQFVDGHIVQNHPRLTHSTVNSVKLYGVYSRHRRQMEHSTLLENRPPIYLPVSTNSLPFQFQFFHFFYFYFLIRFPLGRRRSWLSKVHYYLRIALHPWEKLQNIYGFEFKILEFTTCSHLRIGNLVYSAFVRK